MVTGTPGLTILDFSRWRRNGENRERNSRLSIIVNAHLVRSFLLLLPFPRPSLSWLSTTFVTDVSVALCCAVLCCVCADWAVWGSEAGGFNPNEQRWKRKGGKGDVGELYTRMVKEGRLEPLPHVQQREAKEREREERGREGKEEKSGACCSSNDSSSGDGAAACCGGGAGEGHCCKNTNTNNISSSSTDACGEGCACSATAATTTTTAVSALQSFGVNIVCLSSLPV